MARSVGCGRGLGLQIPFCQLPVRSGRPSLDFIYFFPCDLSPFCCWSHSVLHPRVPAQNAAADKASPAVWRELEQEVFDQINLLRTNPALYADQVLVRSRRP